MVLPDLPGATRHFVQRLALCLPLLLFLNACNTRPERVDPPANASAPATPTESLPVMRYSRYTLVEVEPTSAQQDLLEQVIDVAIPAPFSGTVGDALRYVLLRSGYALCEDRDGVKDLERLPLPAAHFHLGPLRLRQALLLLAGPGWHLEVDELARRVCYSPREVLTSMAVPQP